VDLVTLFLDVKGMEVFWLGNYSRITFAVQKCFFGYFYDMVYYAFGISGFAN